MRDLYLEGFNMKKEVKRQMETELERLLEELTKVDPCSED